MTQVDLESLVPTNSGGSNDRKIVCETLAKAAGVKLEKNDIPDDEKELPPDFPPESFCLSKDAELDWFDRNAVLERKESAKGNSSHGTNVTSNLHPNLNSNSQRIPLTLKTKLLSSVYRRVVPLIRRGKHVNRRIYVFFRRNDLNRH
uniref:Putative ovule protein n=1 Tax=Solanum chacoense TaxID=4108 RepID=A0A0V0H4G1_SOLCH